MVTPVTTSATVRTGGFGGGGVVTAETALLAALPPAATATTLYQWVPTGTPVLVYDVAVPDNVASVVHGPLADGPVSTRTAVNGQAEAGEPS
jgi:hypothetical protein